MKTYKLKKGTRIVYIRVGAKEAAMRVQQGENVSTTETALTPLEANRKVNALIREGYAST